MHHTINISLILRINSLVGYIEVTFFINCLYLPQEMTINLCLLTRASTFLSNHYPQHHYLEISV